MFSRHRDVPAPTAETWSRSASAGGAGAGRGARVPISGFTSHRLPPPPKKIPSLGRGPFRAVPAGTGSALERGFNASALLEALTDAGAA